MDDARTVTVAVTGDQVVDWLLVSRSDTDADVDIEWAWQTGTPFQLVSQPLGAEPLGELLAALLEGDPSRPASVQRGAVPRRALKDPSFRGYLRTFTLWAPMEGPDRRQAPAWRVKRVIGRAEATAPVPVPAADHGRPARHRRPRRPRRGVPRRPFAVGATFSRPDHRSC